MRERSSPPVHPRALASSPSYQRLIFIDFKVDSDGGDGHPQACVREWRAVWLTRARDAKLGAGPGRRRQPASSFGLGRPGRGGLGFCRRRCGGCCGGGQAARGRAAGAPGAIVFLACRPGCGRGGVSPECAGPLAPARSPWWPCRRRCPPLLSLRGRVAADAAAAPAAAPYACKSGRRPPERVRALTGEHSVERSQV